MTPQNVLKVSGFFFLTLCLAMFTIGPGNSAAEEAVSASPEKPEAAPASPAEAKPEAPAQEKSEEAIKAAPAQCPPTATVAEGLPPLKGPKKSIAVMDFEDKSDFSGQWSLGDGIADILTAALAQTNRFVVMERPRIKEILGERGPAVSGRAVKAEETQTGKRIPAQIGVAGEVTEFSLEKESPGTGVESKPAEPGFVTAVAHVGINLTMFDTATEQILFSERVEKSGTYTGIEGDYASKSFATGGQNFEKTPLGKATHEVINDAAYRVALNMDKVPWKGNVILVEGDKIFINCGTREGIGPGQKFVVYSKGEELTDPETSEILGVEETKTGTISVVEVREKHSIARIERGQGFKRGDILRLD